jgi:hypothetical protein
MIWKVREESRAVQLSQYKWEILLYNILRTGKEIRFRFGSSEDKAGKEAKRRPTGW